MRTFETIPRICLVIALGLVAGCGGPQESSPTDTSNPTDAGSTDAAEGRETDSQTCHEIGEPFRPPSGTDDPTDLNPRTHCCSDSAQTVTFHRVPEDGQCKRPDPLRFVCLRDTIDDVCDPSENFCTSPLDCKPPSDAYSLCCREGALCNSRKDEETGVEGCCEGYELVPLKSPSERTGECGRALWTGGICVKDCGDGSCSVGENRCNCPKDCKE